MIYQEHKFKRLDLPGGGGGALSIYTGGGVPPGCAAAHPKRGVLGTGTTQKGGS